MSLNKNYHLQETWEEKYRVSCEKVQWIESSEQSYSKIQAFLPEDKEAQILELGCGTSTLQAIFKQQGYTKITCVDFSKRLIKAKKAKSNSDQLFICADFTEPFKFQPQTQYDLIIDKGSIDCIFCDEDSLRKVLTCVMNCYNRLKDGGKLISISLGLPKNRKYWFRNKLAPFELQVFKHTNSMKEEMRKHVKGYDKSKQENSEDYFIYVCTKNSSGEPNNDEQNNMENVYSIHQQSEKIHQDDQQEEDEQEKEEKQKKKVKGKAQQNDDRGNQSQNASQKVEENQQQQNQQGQGQEEEENYGDQFDQNDQGDQN